MNQNRLTLEQVCDKRENEDDGSMEVSIWNTSLSNKNIVMLFSSEQRFVKL